MTTCILCRGSGRLLSSVCPLCDGVLGWPENHRGYVMGFDADTTIRRGPFPSEGISILAWNVFNPDTIGVANKDNPHYNHLTDEERFWEHRFPKLRSEIQESNASIVCLTEINQCLYE